MFSGPPNKLFQKRKALSLCFKGPSCIPVSGWISEIFDKPDIRLAIFGIRQNNGYQKGCTIRCIPSSKALAFFYQYLQQNYRYPVLKSKCEILRDSVTVPKLIKFGYVKNILLNAGQKKFF